MNQGEHRHFIWQWRTFDALSTCELYHLLQLRQQVFVVEQNCPYLDADGLDEEALHLLLYRQSNEETAELVGCLRILSPGKRYSTPAIGRLAVAGQARGLGIGRLLMEQALHHTQLSYPGQDITISAQQYLEKFYEDLGFIAVSQPYLEDDIAHLDMIFRPSTS
ncbi:GNAT family N-acetyltransferase [Desulfopila aestuarii]|uniref:ElaA protein n=1 Tax=Desulfopila aestuarii DSM 18488 TaxID=1121416 RepID=A0A1M7XVS8_9BACT|nr:GNAT family N-acetyltransferase [Desulfopila aestuarii]SHO42773.1 ElaA protein [Desulfopila aestuarii DSM 18488]